MAEGVLLARRMRRSGQWLEAAGVWLAFGILRLLPLDVASAFGAAVVRAVGPRLAVHRRARKSLARAFPEKPAAEIEKILRAMWDHIGRLIAEYPHLGDFRVYENDGRVELVGGENAAVLCEEGKPGILFSAHVGNWEIASLSVRQRGGPISLVYRAPNNPLVDLLIRRSRVSTSNDLIRKGPEGARAAIETLKSGGTIGMLVDQKMNDGIAVPFFGRPAMTATALARFAYRFNCPIVPVRVERIKGSRFRITLFKPLELPRSGDRHQDVVALMTRVNALVEGWIRERPEQWLWIHRRWPD